MVKKFTIPFASQGDANDIPDALQVDGKVSFTQGFGYDYERPYDDPQAKDIAREDMNGLFKAITSAVGELQTLGASEWSSAISYPKGAIVYYEKDLYISQIDDNQNKPPQSWTSIKNIADDSLKKAANLSDLTNKATARNNLGLGSSATLNKTDVLGTSTSLVATQKLVNDTKINLESSKQDKLTFVGDGPEVMKVGAFGLGNTIVIQGNSDLNNYKYNGFYAVSHARDADTIENLPDKIKTKCSIIIYCSDSNKNANDCTQIVTHYNSTLTAIRTYYAHNDRWTDWHYIYNTENTTTDKSGFLRASGSANALTEADAIPIGTIQAFVGENAPNDKWLLCRGQAFSASNYPELVKLLPGLKVPDLRGVALRGLDANRGFDPNRKLLSYQEDAMQKISGDWGDEISHSYGGSGAVYGIIKEAKSGYEMRSGAYGRYAIDSSLVTRTNTQNETVMKNVAVNFIIKAR